MRRLDAEAGVRADVGEGRTGEKDGFVVEEAAASAGGLLGFELQRQLVLGWVLWWFGLGWLHIIRLEFSSKFLGFGSWLNLEMRGWRMARIRRIC